MPKLLRNIDQNWQIVDEGDSLWQAENDWQAGEPLQVSVDSEPDPSWLEATAIAVDFPALTDGRGLSLAVLLRTRLHYTGDLVARGNVHEDVVHFLARSGFNVIELPEGKDLQTALTWVNPHSGYYQPSVANPETVFVSKN
ncbi:MAG: DUF934 domain-containing protein [Proteobacteria bacterium]|jgi:uncharacterized protein (DUF934 family)|nr:DUF934 domain-containing protein [Pseudomonadota bacterium]